MGYDNKRTIKIGCDDDAKFIDVNADTTYGLCEQPSQCNKSCNKIVTNYE